MAFSWMTLEVVTSDQHHTHTHHTHRHTHTSEEQIKFLKNLFCFRFPGRQLPIKSLSVFGFKVITFSVCGDQRRLTSLGVCYGGGGRYLTSHMPF